MFYLFVITMLIIAGILSGISEFITNVFQLRKNQKENLNCVLIVIYVIFLIFCVIRAFMIGMF